MPAAADGTRPTGRVLTPPKLATPLRIESSIVDAALSRQGANGERLRLMHQNEGRCYALTGTCTAIVGGTFDRRNLEKLLYVLGSLTWSDVEALEWVRNSA